MMDDPVNVVLFALFVVGCIVAIWLTIRRPLEQADPFAEAFGDCPPIPSGSLDRSNRP